VAAFDAEEGTLRWETYLPQGLAAPPIVAADGRTLSCVTQLGGIFDVADDAPTTLDTPAARFENNHRPDATSPPARLPDGGLVFLSDYFVGDGARGAATATSQRELLVLEPLGKSPRVGRSSLPYATGGVPAALRDGVVVPFENGQVHWLDPRTGSEKAEPYQLPMTAGRTIAWSRPAVVGDELYVSDGSPRLYHLGLESQPMSALRARDAGVQNVRPLGRKLAAVGRTLYAIDVEHELLACSLPELRWGQSWSVPGPTRSWEPAVAGSHAFVLERREKEVALIALTGDGKEAWRAPLARSCLAPIADGPDYLVVDDGGDVVRLDGMTGQEKSRVSLGGAPAAEPVIVGDRLVVTTQAGELWWIAKP
jgi:outer membrane protein assembly factor BamB